MTELDALIKCRNHWQWLMITGDWRKRAYLPSNHWVDECACCEFVTDSGRLERDCKLCPLVGIAWSYGWNGCVADLTPYVRWQVADGDERIFWANRMVYACNQAIERLLCGTASTMNQIMTV